MFGEWKEVGGGKENDVEVGGYREVTPEGAEGRAKDGC